LFANRDTNEALGPLAAINFERGSLEPRLASNVDRKRDGAPLEPRWTTFTTAVATCDRRRAASRNVPIS
jgi:hypothetical protein